MFGVLVTRQRHAIILPVPRWQEEGNLVGLPGSVEVQSNSVLLVHFGWYSRVEGWIDLSRRSQRLVVSELARP
jgi:hypothetical protein